MKRRVREEDEIGELNIVPYLDIVTNLLMFMLLSMVGLITLGVLDVGTPKLGEPDPASAASDEPKKEELNLTVGITDRGFYLAGAGGVLGDTPEAQGGIDIAREPTIPLLRGQFDYAGLSARMAEIKKSFPKENRIILVAEMDTPYDIVVQTMDACREQTTGVGEQAQKTVLFPQVWLSMMQ